GGAHLGVGLGARRRRAAAEHLRPGAELDVDLQAHHGVVRGQRLVVAQQLGDGHDRSSSYSSTRSAPSTPASVWRRSRTSSATVVTIEAAETTASARRSVSPSLRASFSRFTTPTVPKIAVPIPTYVPS